jgi:hypothetical protein
MPSKKPANLIGKGAPGPGRNPLPIDGKQVEALAAILCTNEEIAAVLGCTHETIANRFREELDRGREKGRASLRRAQWAAAQKGNPAMLIWLGKQWLEQKEPALEMKRIGELSDAELIAGAARLLVGIAQAGPAEPGG